MKYAVLNRKTGRALCRIGVKDLSLAAADGRTAGWSLKTWKTKAAALKACGKLNKKENLPTGERPGWHLEEVK